MTQSKRCPACHQTLPLDAFGANKARPPLFLQSRCRACTNASKAHSDAVKREAKKASKERAELAAIIADLEGLEVTQGKVVPSHRPEGFRMCAAELIVVPRTRGRWPPRPEPGDPMSSFTNWCDLITGNGAAAHRKARGSVSV